MIAALLALVAHHASVAVPPPTLFAVLAAARRAGVIHRRDKFEPNGVSIGDGERFTVEIAAADGDRLGPTPTSAMWLYKDGRLLFELTRESPTSGGGLPPMGGFILRTTVIPAGTYFGENAFGARRRVSAHLSLRDGIAVMKAPFGESFRSLDEGATDRGSEEVLSDTLATSYPLEIAASGARARALVTTVKVRLEGRLKALPSGSVAYCSEANYGPTVDAPNDETYQDCYAGAEVDRISFIDKASGEILKTWPAP